MNNYSRFIDPCRRSVPVSKELVDADGNCVFGTFDREFESMDLLRARKPTRAPQILNRYRLTLWEATEISLKEGVLLAAVCDMGFFGKTLNIFFDRRTKKVTTWDTTLPAGIRTSPPIFCMAVSRKPKQRQAIYAMRILSKMEHATSVDTIPEVIHHPAIQSPTIFISPVFPDQASSVFPSAPIVRCTARKIFSMPKENLF
jgi:hypothetical protein